MGYCSVAHLSLLFPVIMNAQSANDATSLSERSARVYRIEGSSPNIDGILEENCWHVATPATGFTQKEPVEGAMSTLATDIRFCYDDKALYIGATMHIDNASDIVSTLSRRDNAGNSERIIISIDSYRDRRTAYSFGVTADGVRVDYYHPEDHEFARDYSYDPIWEARVTRGPRAWYAEIRIPFSQLRFNQRDEQIWGVNINRYIPSRNEDAYWILIPKNETGWSSRMGRLLGITGIQPGSRIEITPFIASDLTISSIQDAAAARSNQYAWRGDAGVDMKMGLGPNFTLDATINPDFGQVEADPANVNLSAYEITYEERRPFFVEGSQLLRGRGPSYFYSRRIGAAPRPLVTTQYVETPTSAPIIGATKISGRMHSGMSIAALTALTARQYMDTRDPSTEQILHEEVAPLTGFGVMRLQQEFGRNHSMFGVMLTGMKRDLRTREAQDAMTRNAVSGGTDWLLRFDRGMYEFDGYAGFSYVDGSSEAIAALQQTSTHYFQRPDATHVVFDPARNSLSGYAAMLRFMKNGGKHWLWGVKAATESPGFEINDTGRLQTADDIEAWAFLKYRETRPGPLFHGYEIETNTITGWNYGGIRQYTNLTFELRGTFRNFWNTNLALMLATDGISHSLTRGGPMMGTGGGWSVYGFVRNNYADDFGWSSSVLTFSDKLGSWTFEIDGTLSLRTSGRMQYSIEPGFTRNVNTRQYVGTIDGGNALTYGKRYVFGSIDQGTLFARMRFNYAFTPDLTLEVYAEPFASSGKYLAFGELSAPRSRNLHIYGSDIGSIELSNDGTSYTIRDDDEDEFSIPNPDFNVLSFRSNVVLRWEWRRGSTLFLVWQQNRSSFESDGTLVGPTRLLRSFDSPGDNYIALKFTYWLPLS